MSEDSPLLKTTLSDNDADYIMFSLINVMYSTSGHELIEAYDLNPIVAQKHRTDAGNDLRACITKPLVLRHSSEPIMIPTGLMFDLNTLGRQLNRTGEVPYGMVSLKSSTPGYKLWNQVGIIDQEYRGEVFVKLYNDTNEDIIINPGEKIAQIVFKKALITNYVLVTEFPDTTDRKSGGFGSTKDFDS